MRTKLAHMHVYLMLWFA